MLSRRSTVERSWGGDSQRAARRYPFAALPGDRGDAVEVLVVVPHDVANGFGCGSDDEVGNGDAPVV